MEVGKKKRKGELEVKAHKSSVFYDQNKTIKCWLVERCHVSLKLDNFYLEANKAEVFDFDTVYLSIKVAIKFFKRELHKFYFKARTI